MSKITLNFSAKLSEEGKAAARKLIDGSDPETINIDNFLPVIK